jgi:hypothetical protein
VMKQSQTLSGKKEPNITCDTPTGTIGCLRMLVAKTSCLTSAKTRQAMTAMGSTESTEEGPPEALKLVITTQLVIGLELAKTMTDSLQ